MENEMKQKEKLGSKTWFVILTLIFFFPVGLFCMWKYKKFNPVARIIITAFFAVVLIASMQQPKEPSSTEGQPPAEPKELTTEVQQEEVTTEVQKEEEPEVELKTEEEKKIWEKLHEKGIVLLSIDTQTQDDETDIIIVAFNCENDYNVVDPLLEEMKNLNLGKELMITIGDKKDDTAIVIANIDEAGEIQTTETRYYKSKYNLWVQDQFSAWDGSNIVLTDLIKENLNDEKSYDHIETTYVMINSDELVQKYNEILKQAGKNFTVEKGDLWIQTEFSAKNGFNATIKSMAYGVAGYNSGITTLLAIE